MLWSAVFMTWLSHSWTPGRMVTYTISSQSKPQRRWGGCSPDPTICWGAIGNGELLMEENHSLLKTLVGSPCVCEWLCSCAHLSSTKELGVISKVPISLVDTCLFRSYILSYWVLFICSLQESSPFFLCCPVMILSKAVGVTLPQVMSDTKMSPLFILSIFLQI